jgi:hypothetical protein
LTFGIYRVILNNRRAFANDNFYDLQMLFRVLGDLVKENKIISTGKEKAGGRDYEENKWKRTGN